MHWCVVVLLGGGGGWQTGGKGGVNNQSHHAHKKNLKYQIVNKHLKTSGCKFVSAKTLS